MRLIPLSKNKFSIVDNATFALVSKHKWKAMKTNPGGCYYAAARIDGKTIYMHRLILRAKKGQMIDHRDGNGLNNMRFNLRFCNKAQNAWNSKKKKNGITSRYKGVGWVAKDSAFQARIRTPNGRISLGYFDNERDAAIAYNQKAKEIHGDFACLNEL